MNEMVERVATEIAKVWSSENKQVNLKQAAILFELSALAVIKAMHEPTTAMCNAGTRNLCIDWNLDADGRVAPELWQTMIDEALK